MLNEFDNDNQEVCLNSSCGKIQEEEFCRILDLRKNLQFSDMLIKHMSHYLSLGWHLAAVNSQSQVLQFLNFQEPKEIWSEKLVELSLDGVDLNVGVRTGSASGLLIIEVHKQGRALPFRREDWSSECVAEAGVLFEQHYYELPEGWQLPSSFFLEPFEVKVFGEGDLALAPPSMEPRTQANWRWLKSPWDRALRQPPAILKKIIKVAAQDTDACLSAPVIPSWDKIYPAIARYPTVLQALMSPAHSPESYYQRLLEAAHERGLQEPQFLLGLLWHAPMGDARERPQGLKYLQQLVNRVALTREFNGEGPNDNEASQTLLPESQIQTISEKSRRVVNSRQSSQPMVMDHSDRASVGDIAISTDWLDDVTPSQIHKPTSPQNGNGKSSDNWQEFFRASQENLIVERHRYEAMIYELGKLRVWEEICKQERRENKRLNLKLEAQLTREVEYLRHLLMKKT